MTTISLTIRPPEHPSQPPAPWPSLPPIIAVLYKSGLRPVIQNQPRVTTCYCVHCWLVSASAEKGTTVLAFPIMGFVVKRRGNNKQIYVWGEKLFVFGGKLTPDTVWGGGVELTDNSAALFTLFDT